MVRCFSNCSPNHELSIVNQSKQLFTSRDNIAGTIVYRGVGFRVKLGASGKITAPEGEARWHQKEARY